MKNKIEVGDNVAGLIALIVLLIFLAYLAS